MIVLPELGYKSHKYTPANEVIAGFHEFYQRLY